MMMTMKRLAFVLVFILLFVYAAAQPPSLPTVIEKSPGYSTLQLYQGWNLIKAPGDKSPFLETAESCQKLARGAERTFGPADITQLYVYDFQTKNYLKRDSPPYNSLLQNYPNYYSTTSVWVKSQRDCIYYVDNTFDTAKFEPMKKGWNFTAISDDLLSSNLQSIAGDCLIQSAYYFDAKNKQWDELGAYEVITSPNLIGQGVIINVASDCSFARTTSSLKGTAQVKVTIKSDLDKQPIEGAKVTFYSATSPRPKLAEVSTDAKGVAEASFEDVQKIFFNVNAPAHGLYSSEDLLTAPSSVKNITVIVKPNFEGRTENGEFYRGYANGLATLYVYESYIGDTARYTNNLIEKALNKYGVMIKIIHKDFPINRVAVDTDDFFGRQFKAMPGSLEFKAAEAARCAADQSRFWEYRQLILQHQRPKVVDVEKLENILNPELRPLYEAVVPVTIDTFKQYAFQLNLDTRKFNQCLDKGMHRQKVYDDFQEAVKLGVSQNPTLIFEGRKLEGDFEEREFWETIDPVMEEQFKGSPYIQPQFPATSRIYDSKFRIGNPSIKLTIIEFCDPRLLDCRATTENIKKLIDHYKKTCYGVTLKNLGAFETRCLDSIRFIYKPLPQLDDYLSKKIAMSVYCAHNQTIAVRSIGSQMAGLSRFMEYVDELHGQQSSLSYATLKQIALKMGLDSQALEIKLFAQCLDNDKFKSQLASDAAQAEALSVKNVPVVYIAGYRMDGARTFEEMKEITDSKLNIDAFIERQLDSLRAERTRGN